MNEAGGSFEQAKPREYLQVASYTSKNFSSSWGSQQPHNDCIGTHKPLSLPYWTGFNGLGRSCSHLTFSATKQNKINPMVCFPGDKCFISILCWVFPNSSPPRIQFPLPEDEAAARNLAGTVRSFLLPLGFCCILHSRKLQPVTQMALSEVTLCGMLLHPLPSSTVQSFLWLSPAMLILFWGLQTWENWEKCPFVVSLTQWWGVLKIC